MKKHRKRFPLTAEEKEIETSLQSGDWSPLTRNDEHQKLLEAAAKRSISERKEARVNIRMTEQELEMVRAEAAREGIPYQTLMSSIMHKYLTGQLVDRKVVDEIKSALAKAF